MHKTYTKFNDDTSVSAANVLFNANTSKSSSIGSINNYIIGNDLYITGIFIRNIN